MANYNSVHSGLEIDRAVTTVLSPDTIPTLGSDNMVSSNGIAVALESKEDTLTFDTVPTDGSSNPVTSSGIRAALNLKQNNLTFDAYPSAGSENPVKSNGIKSAIDQRFADTINDVESVKSEIETYISEEYDASKVYYLNDFALRYGALYRFLTNPTFLAYRDANGKVYRTINSKVYQGVQNPIWRSNNLEQISLGHYVSILLDRVPNPPTTNGTYNLRCIVTNGVPTFRWVSI